MSVRCATLLSNELVGFACGQAQLSDPGGRVCRPNGKGTGEDGVLSDVVPNITCMSMSIYYTHYTQERRTTHIFCC